MKRYCVLILVTILMLLTASCSKVDNEKEGENNISETRISLNDKSPVLLDVFSRNGECTIVTTDESYKILHRSTLTFAPDGEITQSNLVEIANVENEQRIFGATISSENCVMYCCTYENGTARNYVVNADNTTTEISIDGAEYDSYEYLNANSILIQDRTGDLRLFGLSEQKTTTQYNITSNQFLASSVVVDDNLVILTGEATNNKINFSTKVFDMESGKEVDGLADLSDAIDSLIQDNNTDAKMAAPILSRNAETKEIYVVINGSIYSIGPDNNPTLWVAGKNTNMANGSMLPVRLLIHNNGFSIVYFDSTNYELKLYAYGFNKQESQNKLTVYMLNDNLEIRQSIAAFQEEFENVEVSIIVGLPNGTNLTTEDAVRQLNLDIMAGGGSDIIVLDGLSLDQFQNDNLLIDISDVLERVKKTDDEYFYNILSCFASGDSGCYAIPTRFSFPSIIANKDIVNQAGSMEGVTDIVESYKDEDRSFLGAACNLSTFYEADYSNIFQNGTISKEELSRYFEQSKKIFNISKETLELNEELLPGDLDIYNSALSGFTDRQIFGMGVTSMLPTSSTTDAEIGNLSSVLDFPLINLAVANSNNDLAFDALSFTENKIFSPKAILGISSSCVDVNLAQQFIEFTLSKEQQKSNQRVGLPVNKIAFKEILERFLTDSIEMGFGDGESYSYGPLSREEIQAHLDLIDSLETPCSPDVVVSALMKEGLESYLRDQVTLDEAVETTYQQISLYLLE